MHNCIKCKEFVVYILTHVLYVNNYNITTFDISVTNLQ